MIFNKPVEENRFVEVRDCLYNLLGSWRPTYNNVKALYLSNGAEWKLTPVKDATELQTKEAWKGMPQAAIDYIKSLPEYDADIFRLVTGIE